jgi:hypothetical protein
MVFTENMVNANEVHVVILFRTQIVEVVAAAFLVARRVRQRVEGEQLL